MSNIQMNTKGGEKAKTVVKRDPQIGIGWFLSIAYGCIFLFNVVSIVTTSSFLQHPRNANSLASLRFDLTSNITMGVFWGLLFFLYLLRVLYILKIERRRQAAAQGESLLLADRQPEREEQKVASPLVVKYHSSGQNYLISAGIVLLVFSLIFGIESIPFLVWGNQVFGDFLDSFSWIPIPIGIVLLIIIGGVVIWSSRSSFNIDAVAFSNGLLKKTSMKEQFIQWSDVRLVAIDSRARIDGEWKPIMLEVVSRDELIQLPWVYQKRTWRTLFLFPQPVLSFEAYEEQMQMLLKVIVGETRLPLYDLVKRGEK